MPLGSPLRSRLLPESGGISATGQTPASKNDVMFYLIASSLPSRRTKIHTPQTIPAVAKECEPSGGKRGLAPGENLVEMFQAQGSVHALSTVLPADLMYRQNANQDSLISDFLTLYVHILSHQDWIEEKIGVIPQTWKGFGVFFRERIRQQDRQGINPEVANFVDWLGHVKNSEENSQFNFLHIEFPHGPYTTTCEPSGTRARSP